MGGSVEGRKARKLSLTRMCERSKVMSGVRRELERWNQCERGENGEGVKVSECSGRECSGRVGGERGRASQNSLS